MFKRRFLTLIGILALLMAVVPHSFAQTGAEGEIFNKLINLSKESQNTELMPLILNEVWPQGIAPIMPAPGEDGTTIPNEQLETAGIIFGELRNRAQTVINLTEEIALNANVLPEVKEAALRVENFVQYYNTLAEMTDAGAIPLEPDAAIDDIGAQQVVQPVPIVIRQLVNPLFITYWRPWPDHPREIEEKVFTAEIPIWGAAVIVKEVRGVKLQLVRGPLPINPCWWWRITGRVGVPWHWRWWWYYYRLVPAEFVKTISYVNKWNPDKRQPEVIKKVEQDVIIDSKLMHFWWFLSDPKAAPGNTEDNPNMGSSQARNEAVVWGNLKRSR
jgi:hypothetical protein